MKYFFNIPLMIILIMPSVGLVADKVVVVPLTSTLQPNWINLDVAGAYLSDGAVFYSGNEEISGIFLVPTGTPAFTLGCMLPPNYKAGTDLTVHIVWSTLRTNCKIYFFPALLSVTRVGSPQFTGTGSSTGLSLVGGNVVSADPSISNIGKEILATITSPDAGTTLQPLDALLFGFSRLGGVAEDTCNGDMMIKGVYISYQAK